MKRESENLKERGLGPNRSLVSWRDNILKITPHDLRQTIPFAILAYRQFSWVPAKLNQIFFAIIG